MRALLSVLAMVLPLTAFATAKPKLSPGELYGHRGGWSGNAYTIPRGQISVHPFIRSAIGLTRTIDLKVPLLGLIIGPHISSEIGLIQNQAFAVSIEPHLVKPWLGSFLDVGSSFKVSGGHKKKALLTGALMVAYRSGSFQLEGERIEYPFTMGLYAVRPEASGEIALTKKSRLILDIQTNIVPITQGKAVGILGVYYVLASDVLGISMGLNMGLQDVKDLNAQLELLDNGPLGFVGIEPLPKDVYAIPLPHFQMWFRL